MFLATLLSTAAQASEAPTAPIPHDASLRAQRLPFQPPPQLSGVGGFLHSVSVAAAVAAVPMLAWSGYMLVSTQGTAIMMLGYPIFLAGANGGAMTVGALVTGAYQASALQRKGVDVPLWPSLVGVAALAMGPGLSLIMPSERDGLQLAAGSLVLLAPVMSLVQLGLNSKRSWGHLDAQVHVVPMPVERGPGAGVAVLW